MIEKKLLETHRELLRIIGRIEDPPTIEETLAILVKDVKEIKEKLK